MFEKPFQETPEDIPSPLIPIKDGGHVSLYDTPPQLQEGIIIRYTHGMGGITNVCFSLLQPIGALHYVFILDQHYSKGFSLSFKTQEYEYATTNLDDESRNQLFEHIKHFVESVDHVYPLNEIWISPASASYSSEEIDECIEKILDNPENTLSREKITERYKGFEIFDLYRELFDKDFHNEHYNLVSRSAGRARLFKTLVQKSFPEWEIKETHPSGDFSLTRKT